MVVEMRLHKDVARLLKDHGYDLVISRTTGTYNPATGKVETTITTQETFRGLFVNYLSEDIDGTSVLATDRKLLLRADTQSMIPEPGDKVGSTVSIIRVQKIQSGDTIIGYVCQTRG